ncbi:MAG: Rrf2 family transcriptional regulator [Anaerolineales bacterium]|nr:Rrf2 family transcriptional regulator [Anaerolineales bacterium]
MSYSLTFSQSVITVLFVADKVQQGIYDFVPTQEISDALNIPKPSAVKILQSLNRAGIIETREGAKGCTVGNVAIRHNYLIIKSCKN